MTRGYDLYCDVVAALKRRPRTAARLRSALGNVITITKMRELLSALRGAGVLRCAGWTKEHHRERIYGVADGRPDLPHPGGRVEQVKRAGPHVARFAAIWQELIEPTSAFEMVETTGAGINACRRLLNRMAAAGLVGVTYESRAWSRTALYQRDGENEPRPPRLTSSEYRANMKANREGRALHQVFTFSAAPVPGRLLS